MMRPDSSAERGQTSLRMAGEIRVLLVEDNAGDARLIQLQLGPRGESDRFNVHWVDRLSAALECLEAGGIDVVLLDLGLPDSQGLETFFTIRQQARDVPVVVMSGLDDERLALLAVQEGAQDYLVKGKMAGDLVARSLRYAVERARGETQLRASEQRLAEAYRNLFEESKDPLFFSTLEGKLTDVNPAAVELFGFSSKEAMLGQGLGDLHADPADGESLLRMLLKDGFIKDFPVEMKQVEGQKLHVLVTVVLIRDDAGNVVSIRGSLRDVTLQKSLQEQFLHAQKMEAIGRLAGGVAHDFNNLLTMMQGSIYFGRRSLPPDHPAQSSFQEIEGAARRAADLTRQLLAFARRQVITPRVVDLNEVVSNLRNLLQRLLGEDVALVTETSPQPTFARIDPGQIEQVLVNLAINARDAMPNGGKLFMETALVSVGREDARRTGLMTFGDHVLLVVRDTGVGMTEDVKSHLFEPFFTTKELGKGTGLGLATCYGIVTQSGGHINVESDPGRGATFRIYLPRTDQEQDADAPSERERPPGALPTGSETILVVEDDAPVREQVVRVLRDRGYDVMVAQDGYEALSLATRQARPIQLLLSDVVMPQIGGMQTADLLRLVLPGVRVLLMSGYTDPSITAYTQRKDGIFFLPKPFVPEVLARRVREILDDGR